MSIATKEAVKHAIDRVKKEKISWYRAAKLEGVSLATIYKAKKKLNLAEKNARSRK